MKILFFSEYFYPRAAGGEVWSWELCSELARRGHQVTVLTQRHDQKLKKEETVQKVKIVRLTDTTKATENRIKRKISVERFLRKAKEEIRKTKFDLIHVMAYTLNVEISTWAKEQNVPCITSAHSYFGKDWQSPVLMKQVLRYIERKNLQHDQSKILHVPSKFLQTRVMQDTKKKSVVIHNWVSDTFPKSKKLPKTLLFVGSLEKIKNPLACIDVAKRLKMQLMVIGTGSLEEALLKKAEAADISCIIVPNATREQTLACIGGASLVLIPSITESFSLVAVEAIAQGTPVSGTPVGILPELPGVVPFPPKKVPPRLSKTVQNKVRVVYSKDHLVSEFEKLYFRVL
jgi:glycogen synthase